MAFVAVQRRDDAAEVKVTEGASAKAIETCLQKLGAAMILVIKSKSPQRFAEVVRLGHVAQQLTRAMGARVEDFAEPGVDMAYGPAVAGFAAGGNFYANNAVNGRRAMGVMNVIGGADEYMNEDQRKMKLALEPVMQMVGEKNSSDIAQNEASEMDKLLTIRERLPEDKRTIIDQRIEALLKSVETRNHAADQRPAAEPESPLVTTTRQGLVAGQLAAAPVVSADVPRGHPPGEEERRDDVGPRVRADGDGGEGARRAQEARNGQAALAGPALGE